MVKQFAVPPPCDLESVDLSEYKGVQPPFDRWSHVADVCGKLSDEILSACVRAARRCVAGGAADANKGRSVARGTCDGSNTAAHQIAGTKGMKHRHLTHEPFTAAAIEDVLARGRMTDWVPLIITIQADPYGDVAEKTRALCERPLYGVPVFRRVLAAARQVRP